MATVISKSSNSFGELTVSLTEEMILLEFTKTGQNFSSHRRTVLFNQMILGNLQNGDLFRFDYNLNEVYQLIGDVQEVEPDNVDALGKVVIQRLHAFWTHEKEWKTTKGSNEYAYPDSRVVKEAEGLLPHRRL